MRSNDLLCFDPSCAEHSMRFSRLMTEEISQVKKVAFVRSAMHSQRDRYNDMRCCFYPPRPRRSMLASKCGAGTCEISSVQTPPLAPWAQTEDVNIEVRGPGPAARHRTRMPTYGVHFTCEISFVTSREKGPFFDQIHGRPSSTSSTHTDAKCSVWRTNVGRVLDFDCRVARSA